MAVTITKNFWNGTEYKSIAKIVFTSPNFTSPATAGTRSHMQPGGKYMGTWFEAVDFMYREFVNQDYVDYTTEMESFFGKTYVAGQFNFASDNVMSVYHKYSLPYQFTNSVGGTISFVDLNQTAREWRSIAASINGNVYACVESGDIYKQSGGVGNFIALAQTSRLWYGLTVAPNGDVYACVLNDNIYKQIAGAGAFTTLSQTVRAWRAIAAAPNGNIYAVVYAGDIYMQTGGTGAFNALSQTSRNWTGIASAPNGDIYACVDNGDIYKRPLGAGAFIPLSQISRPWSSMCSDASGNIYATTSYGDIYIQTNGVGNFTALNQTNRYWRGITYAPNGDMYACTNSYIYKKSEAGNYPNYLYKDKDNYCKIESETITSSGINIPNLGEVVSVDLELSDVVGSGIVNGWIGQIVAGDVYTAISALSPGTGNPISFNVSCTVSGLTTYYPGTVLSGTVSGTVSGMVEGSGTVYGDVVGTVGGTLYNVIEDLYSDVSGTINGSFGGTDYTIVNGTVSGTVSGTLIAPLESVFHQYSNVAINESTVIPKPRRHHGANSIIFAVTFGEAYGCRLTAWDDNTHSTTNNKILDEEHYKVDVVAYRSNVYASSHNPIFRTHKNLVFPPGYDIVLKGNEKYYGDFDLIFSIDSNEYGEYLAFTPRLVNIDDSFIAGSYDFITTLHYQYT